MEPFNREIARSEASGLRILGVSFRTIEKSGDELTREEVEKGMAFVGIYCIEDPPRKEAKGVVQDCKEAGVVVRMVTGDHRNTAVGIARQVSRRTAFDAATRSE